MPDSRALDAPLEERVSPGGSDPAVTLNVYGAVPPLAVIVRDLPPIFGPLIVRVPGWVVRPPDGIFRALEWREP